jgi:RimJ/RimL family protein N-acetyltransferase
MSIKDEDQQRVHAISSEQRLRVIIPSNYVTLAPFTTDHALSFFSQYQLTGIQEMTDLPRFTDASDVCDWIKEEEENKNSYNYAVLLPIEGFAGFVNLIVSDHAAFFAIWLGEKFQGLGLGTQTGRLICEHTLHSDISVIFTAAFVSIHRSIRMLKKVGFEALPISAFVPHNDRIFFILTKDPSIKLNGNNELINFYKREDLPHKFYPNPLASTDHPKPC